MANYYTAGLKGRWNEDPGARMTTSSPTTATWWTRCIDGAELGQAEVSALTGLNTDLRREYVSDCQSGVNRWNKILAEAGLPHRLKLPHIAFNRKVGAFAGIEASPDGELLSASDWEQRSEPWLPTDVDKTHVRSLMQPVHERGKIAAWIAPPAQRHQRQAVRLRVRAPGLAGPGPAHGTNGG